MGCMQFVRGMAVGMALGAVMGMVAAPKKKMTGKKMFTRLLRSVSDAIEDVTEAVGL